MSNSAVKPFQDCPQTPAKLVLRKDLLDKIEGVPAGTILICSMAGYGKSTLLSQLAMRNQPVAVCSLGYSDNDLTFFLGHLSVAVQQSITEPESIKADHPFKMLLQVS